MIEGGLMSQPSCEQTLAHCSLGTVAQCCQNSELILGQSGPCYRINLNQPIGKRGPPAQGDQKGQAKNLGFYLKAARGDLNLSLQVSGTASDRVGYPIVTSNYFGSGYLCGDQWGDKEAEVMCKSMGFSGGER